MDPNRPGPLDTQVAIGLLQRGQALAAQGDWDPAAATFARVVGASTWRIMTKHLFKNSTRTLPVILTLNSSEAILTLAGLGFLGFGIEPTAAAEWGYDLNRSVSDVTAGIWWTR